MALSDGGRADADRALEDLLREASRIEDLSGRTLAELVRKPPVRTLAASQGGNVTCASFNASL